jgi:hypothetical protein
LNPGDTGANVHELHSQLLAIGAVIEPGELSAAIFAGSTLAAVRTFRQQYGLPAGDIVDLPTARLMHAASAFAGSGGRAAMRAAVREAASLAATSRPQELDWLERRSSSVAMI